MHLRITIGTGGEAFHNSDGLLDPGPEVARILREAAARIESGLYDHLVVGRTERPLRDVNGNACGSLSWEA